MLDGYSVSTYSLQEIPPLSDRIAFRNYYNACNRYNRTRRNHATRNANHPTSDLLRIRRSHHSALHYEACEEGQVRSGVGQSQSELVNNLFRSKRRLADNTWLFVFRR